MPVVMLCMHDAPCALGCLQVAVLEPQVHAQHRQVEALEGQVQALQRQVHALEVQRDLMADALLDLPEVGGPSLSHALHAIRVGPPACAWMHLSLQLSCCWLTRRADPLLVHACHGQGSLGEPVTTLGAGNYSVVARHCVAVDAAVKKVGLLSLPPTICLAACRCAQGMSCCPACGVPR